MDLSLEEAEETLNAIRAGEVDAVVVAERTGDRIYTFRDPTHPYRLLVEAMSEGAAVVTFDGVVCYHNPSFAALFGEPGASMTCRALSELVTEEQWPVLAALLERAKASTTRDELTLKRGEGPPVHVQISLSQARLAEVPVFCVVVTDLTEHERREERYRAAQLEIEARDRFLSVAAHELRGPLGVLEMQTHVLAALFRGATEGGPSPSRTVEMLERLNRQSKVLADLVDKLLDFGNISMGRLQLTPEELDLADLVRAVVERFESLLKKSCSLLSLDLPPVRGRWDRVRMEQVVSNLLSNAVKYGEGGPIHVLVELAAEVARLVVEDQGPGIPVEHRERLFLPYERLATAGAAPGLGLGLFITAQIVAAHGGTIRIEGAPGMGARLVVELPLEPPCGSQINSGDPGP